MAELRLEGATVVLDKAALDQLVDQVAERLGGRGSSEIEPWIRGAAAAAAYLGCKPKRVYDLVAQELLECRKDGDPPKPEQRDRRPLMFKREWLDAVPQKAER